MPLESKEALLPKYYGEMRFTKREVEIVHPYFTSEDMSHLEERIKV
jgi:hypothetical protein